MEAFRATLVTTLITYLNNTALSWWNEFFCSENRSFHQLRLIVVTFVDIECTSVATTENTALVPLQQLRMRQRGTLQQQPKAARVLESNVLGFCVALET